ncbi:hypothetical protein JAAARDRAFT_139390, partial [Jaapia argillacea MUCL 33604]
LQNNPIGCCHDLVTACRASDEHRTDFQKVLKQGNESNLFTLPQNELLQDVDTRWSSMLLMIGRALKLHLVS